MATELIQSPKGVAVFPALFRPDTKFDDLGSYKADIALDPELPEVKKFLGKLDAIYKAHMGKVHPKNTDSSNKNAIYYAEADKETGEPTGRIVVKLRVKNKTNRKTGEVWDRRPAQFDAKGQGINPPKNVWGGSVIRVSFEPYCWSNAGSKGVSLQPVAVKIIDLVTGEGGQRSASAYGFDEEEEGFTADQTQWEEEDQTDDDEVPSEEEDSDY